MPPNLLAPRMVVTILDHENDVVGRATKLLEERLLGLSYEDTDKRADKLMLTIDNRDLIFFEQGEDVLGGTLLEVSWGYVGKMSPARRCIIKKITGSTVLKVEALDESFQLHRSTKAREWSGMSRSGVVEEIARELGFVGALLHIEDTIEAVETISQAGETDAAFITRLARREGFKFYLDDTGFHWHSRKFDEAPAQIIEYMGSSPSAIPMVNWGVESNLARRVGRITVKGRDPETKQDIEASATSKSADRATLGDIIEVVDPETLVGKPETMKRSATDVTRSSSATTLGALEREAAARYRVAEREAIKLSVRVVGEPTLRAKSVVEIKGITAMFDGLYFISDARHRLDRSGYSTSLKLIRDAANAAGAPNSSEPQGGSRNRSESDEDPGKAKSGKTRKLIIVVDPETLEETEEWRRI